MKITNYTSSCEGDLLQKVVIPAALGDDTGEFAPRNGAYHNKIVEYESNGAIYIYSSEGIYTKFVSATEFVALEERVAKLEEVNN